MAHNQYSGCLPLMPGEICTMCLREAICKAKSVSVASSGENGNNEHQYL